MIAYFPFFPFSDYHGALDSGIRPMLLRRTGELGESERKEITEVIEGLNVVGGLDEVVAWVRRYNSESA